ncbi:MAG: sugar phosphate isomerase/epimerase [Lentisphaeraceae bacterium]|nr:sugar phosphate isomerase/epimerase [Lentisphaeraceae bacterium]
MNNLDNKVSLNRREMVVGSLATLAASSCIAAAPKDELKISLAQYSLHRSLFGRDGYKKMDSLDFPKVTRSMGIEAVEYVGHFFPEGNPDIAFSKEMLKRSKDYGVKNLLIMVDKKGDLGDPSEKRRNQAVENHKKWVEAAAVLGCSSIRVNARSKGNPGKQRQLMADGLRKLCDFGDQHNIDIIMENHGGLSSNGKWLSSVVVETNHPRCGTLPDFGNFWDFRKKVLIDPYEGVKAMLPHAKAVSAKTYDLVPGSQYTVVHPRYKYEIDFERMMKLTFESGYNGYIGIEYEGTNPQKDEKFGIVMSKKMIETLWAKYKA